MVDFSKNKDDSVVDDYFANSGNRIYMAEVTLEEYRKITLDRKFYPLDTRYENIVEYMATPWQDLNEIAGLYTMHKACVVGSDIYRNGILAPQQMQWVNYNTLVAHPGSDRMLYISALIEQGYIEDRIHMQIEQQRWMPNPLRNLPPYNIKRIENKQQLKEYYKNWNASQFYNVDYNVDEKDAGFMRMFKKNLFKYLNGDSVPHNTRHLEIKALEFRLALGDTLDRFYAEADVDNLRFGPWSWQKDQLIFDPTRAW